jgi:hypothetical protein
MAWVDGTCDWCGVHTRDLPYQYEPSWKYFCSTQCRDKWERANGKDAASLAAGRQRQEEANRQRQQQAEQEIAGKIQQRREYLQRIESGGGSALNDAVAQLVQAFGMAPAKQEQAAPLPDVPPPLPAKATHPEDFNIDASEYTPNGGKTIKGVAISGLKNKAVKIVLIPDKIEGKPVIQIEAKAFQDCRELKMVKIPGSVFAIGEEAFAGCVSLSSVNMPSSLIQINSGAFLGCRSLGSLSFSKKLIMVGDGAFMGCRSIESVTLPKPEDKNGKFYIGEQAFESCDRLGSIKLPQGVWFGKFANSGYWQGNLCAFKGCTALSPADKKKLRDAGYQGEI